MFRQKIRQEINELLQHEMHTRIKNEVTLTFGHEIEGRIEYIVEELIIEMFSKHIGATAGRETRVRLHTVGEKLKEKLFENIEAGVSALIHNAAREEVHSEKFLDALIKRIKNKQLT